MYSRQGILPQVMGVVVNKNFRYRYLKAENFVPIIRRNHGFLPLDEFWSLLKLELTTEVSGMKERLPADWNDITLEEAVGRFVVWYKSVTVQERLQKNIINSVDSMQRGAPLPFQNVFYQSYAIFDECLNYFSAEDRIRYNRLLTPLHAIIAPFPLQVCG